MSRQKINQFFLLLVDLLLFYASLYTALIVRYWQIPTNESWHQHVNLFTAVFFLWLAIFYINNLYNLSFAASHRFWETAIKTLLGSALITIILFYILPNRDLTPKTVLIIFTLIYGGAFVLWRFVFKKINQRWLPVMKLGLIGHTAETAELTREILDNANPTMKIAYWFDPAPLRYAEQANPATEQNSPLNDIQIAPFVDLPKIIAEQKIQGLVLAKENLNAAEASILFDCLKLKINFWNLPDFYEKITGKVPLNLINQAWFLEHLNLADKHWLELSKRWVDPALALIIFIISLPFWPIIVLLIRLTGRGPIFFRQQRLGQNNQPFEMIKFRTMKTDETLSEEKRITGLGKFLRKTRLDEIPQLLNILNGEMSFIGPRPETPERAESLAAAIPFYYTRNLIKPGLTGWDQISGEYHSYSTEDTYKKLQYDLYYLKNRSIYLDFSIAARTVMSVLKREGR